MAQKTLTTSYLVKLSNANHDGVTQQICDRLRDFETENQMLIQAVNGVHQARQKEDAAYRRFSGMDFASDDLRAADQLEDKYMSAIHNILNGLLYLPETEPMRRKAQLAVQLFKDFQFSTSDGMDSWGFFEALLYGANVVCTPGVGFGPSGEGYVRFTAFGSHEKTEEALQRIKAWSKFIDNVV